MARKMMAAIRKPEDNGGSANQQPSTEGPEPLGSGYTAGVNNNELRAAVDHPAQTSAAPHEVNAGAEIDAEAGAIAPPSPPPSPPAEEGGIVLDEEDRSPRTLEEEDLLKGVVRTGTGKILGQMGPETGWSKGNKWKRAQLGKDQIILSRRWHKDHDRWWKRLRLSCQGSHTALAGLVYRGAGGLSRAQTVQILANSLALEIVVLCMQYSESSETLSINLVTIFMAGLFAALVRMLVVGDVYVVMI